MKVEEITDPTTRAILLAKTGLDAQLKAVHTESTALFAAHSERDSCILLQHRGTTNLWQLHGDLQSRLAFKAELEDKLRDQEQATINPGDSVEYYRQRFNQN